MSFNDNIRAGSVRRYSSALDVRWRASEEDLSSESFSSSVFLLHGHRSDEPFVLVTANPVVIFFVGRCVVVPNGRGRSERARRVSHGCRPAHPDAVWKTQLSAQDTSVNYELPDPRRSSRFGVDRLRQRNERGLVRSTVPTTPPSTWISASLTRWSRATVPGPKSHRSTPSPTSGVITSRIFRASSPPMTRETGAQGRRAQRAAGGLVTRACGCTACNTPIRQQVHLT